MAFTPGPWRWSIMGTGGKNPLWVLESPAHDVILTIKDDEFGPTTDPEANRNLLAAAPDLYAALFALGDAVHRWMDDDSEIPEEVLDAATAALRKAEGNTAQ